jgi:alkylation response protein AidB-like acyl-CoA dehydrogenase
VDFEDTPEEAAFRTEVREWLELHATRRPKGGLATRVGMGHTHEAELEHVRRCKQWQRTLSDGGWAGITWPKEFGGRGGRGMQQSIFNQEAAHFDVATGIFAVAIGMVGPTLMAHGTDPQKARFLDAMLRGDEVWCQLFSEPGAGSDLAGLSTRAVSDGGGGWIVNGQKVWTSFAHVSDWAILLARTDSDQPKHRGITYFVVDMRTPGIEVRPLRQINGAAHFNEVFLTDVYIPGDNVIGEVNGGWGPAITTLANERTAIGGSGAGGAFADMVTLARRMGRDGDPVFRDQLAAAYTRGQLIRYLGLRVQTAVSLGRLPGPESSVIKLALSHHMAANGDLVMALSGAYGGLDDGNALDGGLWQQQFLGQWSVRIGGGTEQIQRNIIGERVLGLPREPRVDKSVPFKDLAGSR